MSEQNPWKTLSSKYVYENPWIKVREDSVITPAGKEGIYGVVETKKAVGVIALTDDLEIYLVGQYRYPLDRYSWEIIEGGGESDEEPLETAKRELQEEAGLLATNWEPLGEEIHLSNCFSSERGYLFVARGLSSVPVSPDDTEVLQIKKLPLKEAISMTDTGEITDSLSIIGIYRLQKLLNL